MNRQRKYFLAAHLTSADKSTAGMDLSAVDLEPRIGSQIKADLQTLISGERAGRLRDLLEQRGVLVFRDLNLDDEQQLIVSESLGEVVRHGESAIQKITLDKTVDRAAEYLKGSLFWHIDGACEGVPNLAALLGPRRLAPTGGRTEFANTYAAWDDLPASEKASLEKLRVVHSLEAAQRMVCPEPTAVQLQAWRRLPPRRQPLVWTHRSGRKSLVLGATASHVEGMGLDEGRLLLATLLDWATQPQFVYAHEWKLGDLVIWDNTGTLHRVQPYDSDLRLMHRTTLAGEEALA